MIREPQPCVVKIPADGLVVVGRDLESTQVRVGDKISVAMLSVHCAGPRVGRVSDGNGTY